MRRLIDSWHLPAGVAQYYQWMNLPDGDTGFDVLRRRVVVDRGLAWRSIRVQWAQISSDLDRGTPAALGVVTAASSNPADLALNHQVLAYAYDRSGAETTVRVYDPNRGHATTSGPLRCQQADEAHRVRAQPRHETSSPRLLPHRLRPGHAPGRPPPVAASQ